MPLMLGFCKSYHLRGPKQRPQPDRDTGQRVHSALLTIDDTDGRTAGQPGLAERLDRGHRGAARGDHVLDETDAFAFLEHAFEAVARPRLPCLPSAVVDMLALRERRRRPATYSSSTPAP